MIDANVPDGTLDPTNVGHGFERAVYTDDSSKCLGERTRGCMEVCLSTFLLTEILAQMSLDFPRFAAFRLR